MNAFKVSVDVNSDDGTINAVYFRLIQGKVKYTKELVENADSICNVDFNADGVAVGIELLHPVKLNLLKYCLGNVNLTGQQIEFVVNTVPNGWARSFGCLI